MPRVRCMERKKPESPGWRLAVDKHSLRITMHNDKVFRLKMQGSAVELGSKRHVKIEPNLNAIVSLMMTRAKTKEISIKGHTFFTTSFLDGNAIESKVPHLKLQVVKFASIAIWTLVQALNIGGAHAKGKIQRPWFGWSRCGSGA